MDRSVSVISSNIYADKMEKVTFRVATCEDHTTGNIANWEVIHGSEFKQIAVQDIWGVRRGVAPVFCMHDDGSWEDLGTAFSVDHWDSMITAYHVVEHGHPLTTFAILAHGGTGQYRIPDNLMARFHELNARRIKLNDPLAELSSKERWAAYDLASVVLRPGYDQSVVACLPIRARPKPLSVGDWVVALGFPGLEPGKKSPDTPISRMQLTRAFGRITKLHPDGMRSSDATPVFEVDGHWSGGMSGGPVLDQAGEVVGIVHRGIDPDDDHPGTSWGVWFERLGINDLIPTIDNWHPEVRRCWATVVHNRPTAVFPDFESARSRGEARGEEVMKVRLKLGTKQAAVGWDED